MIIYILTLNNVLFLIGDIQEKRFCTLISSQHQAVNRQTGSNAWTRNRIQRYMLVEIIIHDQRWLNKLLNELIIKSRRILMIHLFIHVLHRASGYPLFWSIFHLNNKSIIWCSHIWLRYEHVLISVCYCTGTCPIKYEMNYSSVPKLQWLYRWSWEKVTYFIPHFIMGVIVYSFWD